MQIAFSEKWRKSEPTSGPIRFAHSAEQRYLFRFAGAWRKSTVAIYSKLTYLRRISSVSGNSELQSTCGATTVPGE
jgi:hypothetical protein